MFFFRESQIAFSLKQSCLALGSHWLEISAVHFKCCFYRSLVLSVYTVHFTDLKQKAQIRSDINNCDLWPLRPGIFQTSKLQRTECLSSQTNAQRHPLANRPRDRPQTKPHIKTLQSDCWQICKSESSAQLKENFTDFRWNVWRRAVGRTLPVSLSWLVFLSWGLAGAVRQWKL